MPIISAGIVTKQGKVILSRQFTDISRIRIEGLLSAFPRLLSAANSKQSTFIETGSVRYVYQPVDSLLLVLITTKTSNIVEDLATLRLMGRIIPEYVEGFDEATITNKTFEILFAFDEIVVNGHRDNNTMEQVMTYLAMESHEEEVAKEEQKQRIAAANKVAKERAAQIKAQKREMGYQGIGSGGVGSGASVGSPFSDSNTGVSNFNSVVPAQALNTAIEDQPAPARKVGGAGGGMTLGKAKKATDTASKILQESGAPAIATPTPSATAAASTSGATSSNGVHIKVDEKISATLHRDGGLENLDVRGDMSVTVADAQLANVRVLLRNYNQDFTFKTHTKINKNDFVSDRVLALKDGKPYPTMQQVEIVRWRLQDKRIKTPISVTCWPGEGSASVEYELENTAMTLYNVSILIPVAAAGASVVECEVGEVNPNFDGKYLRWFIPKISAKENSSASIEFELSSSVDAGAYFPIPINFQSDVSLAAVSVADVVNVENGMPVPFTTETTLGTDGYLVQ
eukprot:GILI01013596.1.p1 GENE.GILI01013596.1~~GILI01013596.1.p1  ORF type:complete len:514 (-),score=148.92 GILI01013596.1:141-1682(-)